MLKELVVMSYEIISMCKELLKDEKSENFLVIGVIFTEFVSILETIKKDNVILVWNKKRSLSSTKIITDSAKFEFNKELFAKVESFGEICKKLDKKFIKIRQ